eukprot:m.26282 g.26282  ORF g.26282 m.26282 type:complete len:568 (+) comp7780_c0_seq2:276-1979(+)
MPPSKRSHEGGSKPVESLDVLVFCTRTANSAMKRGKRGSVATRLKRAHRSVKGPVWPKEKRKRIKLEDESDTELPIIIIGAGPAGLAAAKRLHGKASYLILEARPRAGGRAYTASLFEDKVEVDLGASFIHGYNKDNLMWELVRSTKIKISRAKGGYSEAWASTCPWYSAEAYHPPATKKKDTRKRSECIRDLRRRPETANEPEIYNRKIKPKKVRKCFDIIYSAWNLMKNYNPSRFEESKKFDGDCGVHVAFEEALKKLNVSLGVEERKILESACVLMWSYVCELEHVSLRNQVAIFGDNAEDDEDEEGDEDEELGNDALVLGGYGKLISSTCPETRKVHFNTNVCRIKHEKGVCTVTTRDNKIFKGCAVIVTVPLGVLKNRFSESKIEFIPPLSKEKQLAIDRLGYGVENKVVLQFEEWQRFWPNVPYFNCTDIRFRFLNFDFFKNNCVIVAHMQPPFSNYTISKKEVVDEVMTTLRQMFGPAVPQTPSNYYVTAWHKDPFAGGGSYSFQRVGSLMEDIETLGAAEGGLLFAGEACSALSPQCVHGAYDSGITAAEKALAMVKGD